MRPSDLSPDPDTDPTSGSRAAAADAMRPLAALARLLGRAAARTWLAGEKVLDEPTDSPAATASSAQPDYEHQL